MLGSWEHEKAAGWEYESSIFNLWRAVKNRLEIIKRQAGLPLIRRPLLGN
jgi:hypothetical protein